MDTSRVIIFVLWCGCLSIAYAQPLIIEVEAGDYFRVGTLVEVQLKNALPKGTHYQVKNKVTGRVAAVQSISDHTVLFVLPDSLAIGSKAIYQLQKTKSPAGSKLKVVKEESGVWFEVDQKKVLFYATQQVDPPAGNPAYYARSGFIHPLYSPSGSILTDDFPVGHVHQHGIMMAWVNTTFKNTAHDFWNQQARKGNVRHIHVVSIEEGTVFSRARFQLQHYTPVTHEVLNETWTLTMYPFSDYFLFDIRSDQVNTTSDTLFLNKYHYSGMAFRGSRQWNSDDTLHFKNPWQVVTDSGYGITEGNGKKAAYVSVEGTIDGRVSGVTVFGFPDNFRYPQSIRIHPSMPYWCYAPVADGAFAISPQQTYSSRYRYYVHDGSVDQQVVKQLYRAILHPPVVRVKVKAERQL